MDKAIILVFSTSVLWMVFGRFLCVFEWILIELWSERCYKSHPDILAQFLHPLCSEGKTIVWTQEKLNRGLDLSVLSVIFNENCVCFIYEYVWNAYLDLFNKTFTYYPCCYYMHFFSLASSSWCFLSYFGHCIFMPSLDF